MLCSTPLQALSWPLDLVQYPLLGEAKALDLVLGPGDVLFLPSFWTHFIVSLTGECAGFRWK